MSKGSQRRPSCITKEAWDLQWDRTFGKVTQKEYLEKRKKLELEGK